MELEERKRFNKAVLKHLGYRMELGQDSYQRDHGFYELVSPDGEYQYLNGAQCDTEAGAWDWIMNETSDLEFAARTLLRRVVITLGGDGWVAECSNDSTISPGRDKVLGKATKILALNMFKAYAKYEGVTW